MPKKAAFVDIDGCLVIEGKLNQALVEQLKAYDEIILFTQRSMYLQVGQISRSYLLSGEVGEDTIVNTCDAVDALSKAIGKKVKVSTSVDQCFGPPTEYYETALKPFEQQLKEEAASKKDKLDFAPFNKRVSDEAAVVRKHFGIEDERAAPDTFYPQGKVEQCQGLMSHLPQLLGTEDITVDFFDDSKRNLNEVIDSDLRQKPNCMVVSGTYICPIAKFHEKYGIDADPRDRKIQAKLQEDPIAKLSQYIAIREAERESSDPRSEYKSKWAEIFRPDVLSATTKISAAKKAIRILQGEENVVMTENELKALQQGRSKDLIGDAIDIIKESQEQNDDRHVFH